MALNFTGAVNAAELEKEDANNLRLMLTEFNAKHSGNVKRMSYYDDSVKVDMLGLSLPKSMESIDTSVGWAAKSVDMLADRSSLACITLDGENSDMFEQIISIAGVRGKYRRGKTSQLSHCCGFWTVARADELPMADGAKYAVAVNYRDAETAFAWWDKANSRIEQGFTVDGWMRLKNGSQVPSKITVYKDDCYIVIDRDDAKTWHAEYKPHANGRVMMVAMPYRPTDKKPFGRSRITQAVQAITQAAKRETIRLEVHSEFHSTGQKWAMGVDDSMFDLDRFTLASHSFLMATRDENGDVPSVGQFQQQSPEAHIAVMEHLACRMASETNIPVSSFGVLGNGYTSSEALAASSNNLICEAENMNAANGDVLREVCELAISVALNKRMDELSEGEKGVKVTWEDPSMLSASARADFAVKTAAVIDGYGNSRVCLEHLGFDSDTCDRIEAEKRDANDLKLALTAFGGNDGADNATAA